MIYLDYSATTKTSKEVLDKFIETEAKYFANPNSNHKLGKEALNEIKEYFQLEDLIMIQQD